MTREPTEEEASQAALHALGLLPPEEARRFEAAMAADAELADLVARLETGAAAFAWEAPLRDPPPALRGRIMSQVISAERAAPALGRARGASWTPWVAWAVAACMAVLAGRFEYEQYHLRLLVDDFHLRDLAQTKEMVTMQARTALLQRRLTDAITHLAADGKLIASLQSQDALSQVKIAALASMLKDTPQAMAVIAWDGATQRGIVKALNMPAAGADQDYQLWIIDPDYKGPVSAGVFDPSRGGGFQPVRRISKVDKFAVSLEQKGGSPAPHGPIVLVGE